MWRVYYVWYSSYTGLMLTISRRHLPSCKHSSKGRRYAGLLVLLLFSAPVVSTAAPAVAPTVTLKDPPLRAL